MLPEIREADLAVIVVGAVVTTTSENLGSPRLHAKGRFWGLLEMNSITPKRVITPQGCKALAAGHAKGSVSHPVLTMFLQKKTSQLLKLGIGSTDLNRRVVAGNEKDKAFRPTQRDIQELISRAEKSNARILAFVTSADVFVGCLRGLFPGATGVPGPQPFTIWGAEAWLPRLDDRDDSWRASTEAGGCALRVR